ncbi:MAG TPA: hypothetical protein VFW25_05675 [Silvibacterium sp.]|nr:hypothetical protein [Silvibacterium sp.]
MATQVFRPDYALLLPRPTDPFRGATYDIGHQGIQEDSAELEGEKGNVFRGFFFAMLFNLFLLLTGAAGWEVWRAFW